MHLVFLNYSPREVDSHRDIYLQNWGMRYFITSYFKCLIAHWSKKRLLRARETQWRKDPLSHPDIQQMSERERADLQFNPHCIESE